MPSCSRQAMLWTLLWLGSCPTEAFTTPHWRSSPGAMPTRSSSSSSLSRLQATVEEMKAEAERVRLEAELLEQRLTLSKIERLEEKLENKSWLAKHPEQEEDLERQLQALQRKLALDPTNEESISSSSSSSAPAIAIVDANANATTTDASSVRQAEVVPAASSQSNGAEKLSSTSDGTTKIKESQKSSSRKTFRQEAEENPICGFDQDDLEAYLPVAYQLEASMPNSTADEKLITFRAAPELQEHFQKKIKAIILQPMEDMQKLEELRSQFLYTRSRVEKENLRRQITQLEKELEQGHFGYSETIFADIPPMSEEDANERFEAVSALPSVMRALYTRRTKAPDDDIALAIQLDHYEAQIQLLEQIKFVQPWTKDLTDEATQAIESLPMSVRNHLAKGLGLTSSGDNTQELLDKLLESEESSDSVKEWSNMQEFVVAAGASGEETDDLDFIDRSRYAEEFYPSIARMEGKHPSLDDMDMFIREVVDRRAFMVQSKPERVVGGWYLRGENLLSEDEGGVKLVKCLMERLEASPRLAEKLDFFYIPDPSPLADEDFEMDMPLPNVLYVTGKDPEKFYNNAGALTKFSISSLGVAFIALFSLASVEMVPALQVRLDAALTTGNEADLEWLVNIVAPVFLSMMGIYSAHEVGHGLVALRDKFKIGFGGPIPSIQTGFLGAITPLESPPPSMKSMFDFAMAGPMLGFLTSLAFFVVGLHETAAAGMNSVMDLPGLPTFLLRSSALCSGLVEFFLGKGTLLPGVSLPAEAVLPLHPFAISGYVGLVVNALALLPLGNTDGGRISVTMFGRRGAYLISTFTTVLLTLVGLFGWDDSRIFLSYTLFALLWQRELETPARNEVEELDFGRGAIGLLAALFVGLTLVPFL